MKNPLLLNADLGEGYDDDSIMPLIDLASIACGGHAGDRESMDNAILLAKKHNVRIGAHPSYADPENFGRRSLMKAKSLGVIVEECISQILALQSACEARNANLSYIKPHGALYHDLESNRMLSQQFIERCMDRIKGITFIGSHQGFFWQTATFLGCDYLREAYADRRYDSAGKLIARSQTHRHPVLQNPEDVLHQVKSISEGHVIDDNGEPVLLSAETICVHGDTPGALVLAQKIRETLGR